MTHPRVPAADSADDGSGVVAAPPRRRSAGGAIPRAFEVADVGGERGRRGRGEKCELEELHRRSVDLRRGGLSALRTHQRVKNLGDLIVDLPPTWDWERGDERMRDERRMRCFNAPSTASLYLYNTEQHTYAC